MATASTERLSVVRAFLFTVAGQPFAVEVGHAKEVVVFEDWTAVPGAPAHLVGVANLRGHVIPILSIEDVLGLPRGAASRQIRALVVAQSSAFVALVIESTLGLDSFEEVIPCGVSAQREYGDFAHGLVEWKGRMVPLLDALKVLAALKSRVLRTS